MHPVVYQPARRRVQRDGHPACIPGGAYLGPAPFARKRAAHAIGRAALVFLLGAGFGLAAGLPLKAGAAPFGDAPIEVPAQFAAEKFNRGGEGVGYHDRSPGNAGGVFRPEEGVDIVVIEGGGRAVNNFQTGEWLAYTIKVPEAGRYDIHLRASTTYTSSSFHLKIDDEDVTGPIAVPVTGGWNTFKWVGKRGIRLSAGRHVLKVFANRQYFNLDAIRVRRTGASGQAEPRTPYNGKPFPIPGVIQAEQFDRGGEGIAYHDRVKGNAGKQFRAGEDVDIVKGPKGGGYVVNNFQTGEWMKYSIDVAETAQYDIAVRVASGMSSSALNVLLNGKNVTGSVPVPNTGGWDQFKWVTRKAVTLQKGEHVLKLVSDQQYFNVNSIRILKTDTTNPASNPNPDPNPDPQAGARQFFCTFQGSPGECGFGIQAKSNSRVAIVGGGRDGSTAVRLRTEPGDNNVFGSGSSERADLSLSQGQSDCSEGREAWWAHSVMFPSDYVPATDGFGVAMDFHHTGSSGQANFHLDTSRWDGRLHFRGYGGSQDQNEYGADLGPVVKNQWYDFVYHVRWSSGSDGFMRAWVNGKKKLDHSGPTLYAGQGCYLKLANYHSPFGQGSSVIHDRVIRGSTWQAVSPTALEGVQ